MAPLLTVIGDLVEDVVVWSRSIGLGTDNPATVQRTRGGSAANVAAFAAPLGPTRFLGRVGDDDTGRRLVAELEAVDVDVRVQVGGVTGAVVVVVTADGERTMFPDRRAAAELADLEPAWLAGTTALHLPAYGLVEEDSAAVLIDAARLVRESGGAVSVDLSAVSVVEAIGRDRLPRLLDSLGASLVFANRDESVAAGAAALAAATAVVKDGPRPTRISTPDGSSEIVAVTPVDDVRDTTGAGDAFAAGFLTAWMRGADPATAARAGHALAATVLRSAGAAAQPHRPSTAARA